MFDIILLEIFKFVGFLVITGALAFSTYSLWWGTFIKSKRGDLLTKFILIHKESYIDWLEEREEYGELNRIVNGLEEEEQDDL